MDICYIHGEENCVADALSCIPEGTFPDKQINSTLLAPHHTWNQHIGSMLSITTEQSVLKGIKDCYQSDDFCICLAQNAILGAKLINDLWYIRDHLVIPSTGNLHENLFHLTHDTLGHFGADKCYANLCNVYYWPNMWTDLETLYVPSCTNCQWNKSWTTKAPGPLHPLPISNEGGDSVVLDFIGPLPEDDGYNCILTMTDHLGSDYCLIPTRTNASAEDIALLVFSNWYCENGLSSNFVSNCDKLFVSHFWKARMKLTGIKLKMSSAYHPEMNGCSEHTNKTINQAIHFHAN